MDVVSRLQHRPRQHRERDQSSDYNRRGKGTPLKLNHPNNSAVRAQYTPLSTATDASHHEDANDNAALLQELHQTQLALQELQQNVRHLNSRVMDAQQREGAAVEAMEPELRRLKDEHTHLMHQLSVLTKESEKVGLRAQQDHDQIAGLRDNIDYIMKNAAERGANERGGRRSSHSAGALFGMEGTLSSVMMRLAASVLLNIALQIFRGISVLGRPVVATIYSLSLLQSLGLIKKKKRNEKCRRNSWSSADPLLSTEEHTGFSYYGEDDETDDCSSFSSDNSRENSTSRSGSNAGSDSHDDDHYYQKDHHRSDRRHHRHSQRKSSRVNGRWNAHRARPNTNMTCRAACVLNDLISGTDGLIDPLLEEE